MKNAAIDTTMLIAQALAPALPEHTSAPSTPFVQVQLPAPPVKKRKTLMLAQAVNIVLKDVRTQATRTIVLGSLPAPAESPVEAMPNPPRVTRRDYPQLLAVAIRSNNFESPQRLLLGRQMTPGHLYVKVLQFAHMEVRADDLRRAFLTLSGIDQGVIECYVWFSRLEWDAVRKRNTEIHPDFGVAASAFERLFAALKRDCLLKPRTRRSSGEDDQVDLSSGAGVKLPPPATDDREADLNDEEGLL